MQNKEDLIYSLQCFNNALKNHNLFFHLRLVGGASLIMHDINYSTEDADHLGFIDPEIQKFINNQGIDINNDCIEYLDNFDDAEWEMSEVQFSNLSIEQLTFGSSIYMKMTNSDDTKKAVKFFDILSDEYDIELTVESIIDFLKQHDTQPDRTVIENFVDAVKEENMYNGIFF